MNRLKIVIKESRDGFHLGEIVETDLQTLEFVSGEIMDIEKRIHVGSGVWKLWNSTYAIEVEEIGQVTGYEVSETGEIVSTTIKKEVE